MSDKYKSTEDQMNGELKGMFEEMKDPILQDQKELEVKHKENVSKTSKRYGIS